MVPQTVARILLTENVQISATNSCLNVNRDLLRLNSLNKKVLPLQHLFIGQSSYKNVLLQ